VANDTSFDNEIKTETLIESENYMIWSSEEPDGEISYHLDLGPVTLHFFKEEWEELLALFNNLDR
jgi:hypothetical protein